MNERFTYEATFKIEPDDAAFDALFGDTRPCYEVTLTIPARRRSLWEWLTRKPRHLARTICIPNAQLIEQRKDGGTTT